ncbi:GrpB family protein [Alkalibacterium sp. f15]|uniref:GrpB family protein n=1 Tax=Alkalibacterium sp. f15 TaxID=3414029 RepID=UPI003BF8BE39
MHLGLKRNEVRLLPHDQAWKNAFEEVKESLLKHTSLKEYQIEHVGSTAIKEVKAKPIIDILVGIESIDDDISLLEKDLRTCDFYRLRVERPNEIVFAKFTDESFESKTHYIHLTKYRERIWNDLIYFRNHLNTNEAARKEYEQIKLEFVRRKREGIKEYTDLKEAFVTKVLNDRNDDVEA